MVRYPWYAVVGPDEPLSQGDFISSCPVVIPPPDIKVGKVTTDVMEYNVTIMTQSCDLEEKKIDLILVCPVWPLTAISERDPHFKHPGGKESLRKGRVIGYHMLNKCDISGFETDYQIVDFRSVYAVPLESLLELAKSRKDRLRLLPPYREHLSQAFARFFMRVGLPVGIPVFK